MKTRNASLSLAVSMVILILNTPVRAETIE